MTAEELLCLFFMLVESKDVDGWIVPLLYDNTQDKYIPICHDGWLSSYGSTICQQMGYMYVLTFEILKIKYKPVVNV